MQVCFPTSDVITQSQVHFHQMVTVDEEDMLVREENQPGQFMQGEKGAGDLRLRQNSQVYNW